MTTLVDFQQPWLLTDALQQIDTVMRSAADTPHLHADALAGGLAGVVQRFPTSQIMYYADGGAVLGFVWFTALYGHPHRRFTWMAPGDPRTRSHVQLSIDASIRVQVSGLPSVLALRQPVPPISVRAKSRTPSTKPRVAITKQKLTKPKHSALFTKACQDAVKRQKQLQQQRVLALSA